MSGRLGDNVLVEPDLPALDRMVLVAFGVVGTLWVIGLAVFVFLFNQGLVPVAAAYVVVFAPAIASTRLRTGVVLLVAWAVAVLSMGVLVYGSDVLIGEAVLLGGLVGTALFGLWVLPSYLLLLGIDPDRRLVTER